MARFITTQSPDTIVYRGRRMILLSSPLETHPDPVVLERLRALAWTSPRLRRGYVTEWRIEDDKILLTGLQVRAGRRSPYSRRKPKLTPLPLDQVFPESRGPIPATWVDGALLIGVGHGCLERLGVRTSFHLDSILAVNGGVIETAISVGQAPDLSTLAHMIHGVIKRIASALSARIPKRFAKLRLRRRRR